MFLHLLTSKSFFTFLLHMSMQICFLSDFSLGHHHISKIDAFSSSTFFILCSYLGTAAFSVVNAFFSMFDV